MEARKQGEVQMYLSDIETSLKRILLTPLGSRVLEPEFGSNLHLLVDRRVDKAWMMLFSRYVYEAIKSWEPRVKLQRATPKVVGEKVSVELEYLVVDKNEIVKLEILWK